MLALQTTSLFEAYGGIEYYFDDFLTHLHHEGAPHGNGVTALIARRREWRQLRPAYRPVPIPFAAAGWRAKRDNRFSIAMFREAYRALRAHPQPILYGHVSLGPLAYALHRATGMPYFATVYGLECWGDLFGPDEWTLRRAHGIFSISRWTKQVLVDRGYAPEKIAIVHPQMPAEYATLAEANRPPRADGPLRLLSISRLDPNEQYKGQDHVIEALARLRAHAPELKFSYTIQGEGADRPRLAALVERLALGDGVHFAPGVKNRADFAQSYREHDVYVMPSRFGKWDGRWRGEGFGIVYVEAAIFGLPSIAYDAGGAKDIIVDRQTGRLVPPDDIGALAGALAELARDRARVTEWGRAAFRHVHRHFSPDAVRAEVRQAVGQFTETSATGNPATSRSRTPAPARGSSPAR